MVIGVMPKKVNKIDSFQSKLFEEWNQKVCTSQRTQGSSITQTNWWML